MNPKQIWANFAVSDLDRTTRFYTSLGFTSNGRSQDLTSFFFGENKLVIHFFLKKILEPEYINVLCDSQSSNEILFTISAENRDQVDRWALEVEEAGGKLVTKPEEFGKGYYGFIFADPDGHRFNVFNM